MHYFHTRRRVLVWASATQLRPLHLLLLLRGVSSRRYLSRLITGLFSAKEDDDAGPRSVFNWSTLLQAITTGLVFVLWQWWCWG